MSEWDRPHPDGWWQASDGYWYPPEAHPAHVATATGAPTAPSAPSMSDAAADAARTEPSAGPGPGPGPGTAGVPWAAGGTAVAGPPPHDGGGPASWGPANGSWSTVAGAVAASQPQTGRRVLGGLMVGAAALISIGLFAAIAVAVIKWNGADRDSSGSVVRRGEIALEKVKVGDCFDNPGEAGNGEVVSVEAVPCDESHDFETFAIAKIPGDRSEPYPGQERIEKMSTLMCGGPFTEYVGKPLDGSIYDFSALYPLRDSWENSGDRDLRCALTQRDGKQMKGSAKGSGK